MSASESDTATGHAKASVVLIAPDTLRRAAISRTISGAHARLVRDYGEYPDAALLALILASECDAILVDLDGQPERALAVIEAICSQGSPVTLMACSSGSGADVLMPAMRAGAREFFSEPMTSAAMAEAFDRASTRRRNASPQRHSGKVLVFRGAKGGAGVTTLAINFAVALRKESRGSVALVDLHPQLGEVALGLGLTPRFSIVDALANASRLDADFLATLLTTHDSGVAVLASRDEHSEGAQRSLERGAEKLFRILREEFDFVVVDAGPCSGNTPDALFELADTIYLVTEGSLPALRNTRRMITYFARKEATGGLELVLNRSNARLVEIDEDSIRKALTRAADWKIPNDYPAVRGAQNLGVSLVAHHSPIAAAICQMAKAACGGQAGKAGQTAAPEMKGEKWKFWTSNNIKALSTLRFSAK